MSLHPNHDEFARSYERSAPARVEHPFPDDAPHPRCLELAEAMREGSNTWRLAMAAGFTAAEIAEFWQQAGATAAGRPPRQTGGPRGDLLADMKLKAREAVQNFRPLPAGTADSQALYVAWGAYCAARNAFSIDPAGNDAQRARCIDRLEAYFRLTTAGPSVARAVVAHVEDMLAGRVIHRAKETTQ